jgi:LuxR family transcriptional regulator, maltose regulon positive regulatory protein
MAGHPFEARCADSPPDQLGPVLIVTKMRPPTLHDQVIPRTSLLEHLRVGAGHRLTLVACPAGFGKTTTLAAWREAETARKPVAWLTLDEGDNDSALLWSYITAALHRVCPAIGRSDPAPGAASVVEEVLPRLVNELSQQDAVTLILDDWHWVSDDTACQSLAWFIKHAPLTFQLVLSTRTVPSLPLAAMRAHGELLEFRSDDLRFTGEEAATFLNGRLALGLRPDDIAGLVERTAGWPAGLYLAALSLRRTTDRNAAIKRFEPSHRHVADFLVAEALDPHDQSVQALMIRSSILKRLSGPLCDAVLQHEQSGAVLETLSRANLFLEPVPGEAGWYRFHPLFARLLRAELERREPGLVGALHRRAYAWHRDHGVTAEAIQHALQARAYAEAAELIEATWVSYASGGRSASVLAWIRQFPDEIMSGNTPLLLVEGWILALLGKRQEAAHAIAAVGQAAEFSAGPLPDGFSSAEASLTSLRASFPWGDVGTQLKNARRAVDLEDHGSPWRPVVCWAMGMALYVRGELDEADRWFVESLALTLSGAKLNVDASSLAYRSLIAGEQGRIDRQRLLAEQATELVLDRGTEKANGAVPLALGVSLAARGRPRAARPLIERGVAALRRPGSQPTEAAVALLHYASALRALDDRQQSLAVTAEARSVLESCRNPGVLTERLRTLERGHRMRRESGKQELTRRELRVLKLLDSDLSERAIGTELFVSFNTVHSHIRAIYRKLGVCSRTHALERARELELV